MSNSKRYRKFIEQVVKALPNEEKIFQINELIQNPSKLRKKLASVFQLKFPIWKTIRIGYHDSVKELILNLESKGYKISDWARDLMNNPEFQIFQKQEKLNLAKVTVADLGFPDGATTNEILNKIREMNSVLTPDTIPYLRLVYPGNEWMIGMMKPIIDSDNFPSLLRIRQDNDGLWIDAFYGSPKTWWNSGSYFVINL